MKRVLLLLLIATTAISVSAQRDYRGNDREERYHYKHDRRDDVRGRNKNIRNREEYQRQVAAINHNFDDRVRSIRRNPFMGRNQKNRRIQELEMHRRVALNDLRATFSGNRKREYARERKYNNRKW